MCLAVASAWAEPAVRVKVLSEDGTRIVVRYELDHFEKTPVTIDGESFAVVSLPGEAVGLDKGAPGLPHVNRSLVIPDGAAMKVRVLDVSYHDELLRVAPSKGNLSRKIDPDHVPYVFGDAYAQEGFAPAALAKLGEPYILRDHRGVVLELQPFQYNAASGTLRVYDAMTVEISVAGQSKVNLRGPARAVVPRAFRDLYRSHFLNAPEPERKDDGTDYDPLDEQGEMLIITHDPWINTLDSFVSHKGSMGITATVVGVSTIGNDSTSILNYVRDYYNSHDLAFVLLVGDAAEVAPADKQVGGESGASDAYYSKLAGSDDYPEIIVGRFSAQTEAQLNTMITRTIDYETEPANQQPWFKKATGLASNEGGGGQGDEGQSDKVHMGEIRDWLLADGYTEVDEIYDPGATDQQVADALNAGRGLVNYVGHGSSSSWSTSRFNVGDVDALTNVDMLPFIISVACNNGEFHHYDKCFGEAWLRATHNDAPTGAVTFYGSSVSQSWSPPMEAQDEFNILLTDDSQPYQTIGALYYAGSCSMMDDYGSGGVDMFDTWILFGDPSLRVIGAPAPQTGISVTPANGLDASGPAGGPMAPASLEYTVKNNEDTPVDYEVRYDARWLDVSNPTGTIAAQGTASVLVSFNGYSRDLDNGRYEDTLEFVNLTSSEGDTSRVVTVSVGARGTVQQWTMDTDPGFTTEGEWEYGTPLGQGGGYILNPDPSSGATGNAVYGVNLAGNFSETVGGPYYLTLGPVDLSEVTGTEFGFQRWLNTAGGPYVSSKVEVSADGANWSELWHATEHVTDDSWQPESYDVAAILDGSASAYVRWSYEVVETAPLVGSGWNIDDVVFSGLSSSVKIRLLASASELSWNAVPGALSYDVLRGDLDALFANGGDFSSAVEICLADDHGGLSLAHGADPAAGQGFFYLVRANAADGAMTYNGLTGGQAEPRDDEIAGAPGRCP